MTEFVENQVTGVWLVAGAVTACCGPLRGRLRGRGRPDPLAAAATSMSGPVPRPFQRAADPRRAVAFASVPLADMKTVNKAFGGSIANVFLAACTLSLRAWLQRHDAVPADPLLMQVPLSLPDADPTDEREPVEVSGGFASRCSSTIPCRSSPTSIPPPNGWRRPAK